MKFFVSAGEVSGDIHAAYLVAAIKSASPGATFFGVGSGLMSSVGVEVKFDISKRGTIGLVEALPNIASIYTTFLKVKELIISEKPDCAIFIDSQGFNVPIANFCRSQGIKTVYYIAPQEWLWGTPRGVKKIASSVDRIVSIFAKEHEIFKAAGANSVYFGHPLIDIVNPTLSREETRARFNFVNAPLVCICPGSRTQEIKNIFPVLLESAKLIKMRSKQAQFFILSSSPWIKEQIKSTLSGLWTSFPLLEGPKYDLLNAADLVLAASGTINLECSILGVPNIMVYKLNPLTYWIGKNILKLDKKLSYFSMPNILLNSPLVPEFPQDKADPVFISEKALSLIADGKRLDNAKLLSLLGHSPVIQKIAGNILHFTSN